MGCNGRTFEDLPPKKNSHVRMGCKRRTFEELPPNKKFHLRVDCNGGLLTI